MDVAANKTTRHPTATNYQLAENQNTFSFQNSRRNKVLFFLLNTLNMAVVVFCCLVLLLLCCCPSGCAKASDDWPTGTTPFYIICPSFFFFFFLLLGSHQKEKKNRDETSQRESRMDGPVMTGRIRQDDDSPNTKLKFIVCLLYAMPPIVIPLAIDLHPSRNKHHATSITGCRLTN